MLKNKNFKTTISVFLLIAMVITTLSSCGKAKDNSFQNPESIDASKYYDISGNVILENDGCRFELNSETTHFTVTDLKNNLIYTSVPEFKCNTNSDEIEKQFVSEMKLTYYDNNSKEYFMFSTADSVEKGSYKVAKSDDSIRVTYTFGEDSQSAFAPTVLTVEDYNEISQKLSSSQNRRLKLCYTLYSVSDPVYNFDQVAESYPIIKKRDLYILNNNISELQKSDIDGYMKTAGYTPEENEKLLEELDLKTQNKDVPGFTVPVEYSLHKDGFKANVLYDLVEENSKNFKLQSVTLLPNFGATDGSAKGNIMVPDGSGSIIEMNSKVPANYVSRFYGNDLSITFEDKHVFKQNQYFPLWGVTHNKGSFIAIVESDSANAELYVDTLGDSSPANTSYVTFDYRTKDTEVNVNMATSGSAEGIYNLYSEPLLTEFPSVKYCFLNSDSSYVDMAEYYREYLTVNEFLNKSSDKTDILLDFICVTTKEENICGIPYDKKIVLTTLSEIKQNLEELYSSGVSNISVRLIGSTKSGINHSIGDEYDIYKEVGSPKELDELSKLVKENGGNIYLDADFQTVYSDGSFDSFSSRKDVSYTLGKKVAGIGSYNVVNGESKEEGTGYLVSPSIYKTISKSFINSISELKDVGVAYINAGKILSGNYSNSDFISRDVSLGFLKDSVNSGNNPILIGGGNIYALTNADFVTDISFDSSKYDFESISVPFWQLVMHGVKNYSGYTYNNSYNREKLLLQSIETGAALHFVFIGKSDNVLIEENLYTSMSSISANERLDSVISLYNQIKDFRNSIKNINISEHKCIESGLYKTVYSNGAYSIVNYTDEDKFVGDIKIGSNGFYMKGAE